MRTKQDNLLKIAERYAESSFLDYDYMDEKELNKFFVSVIKDYGRIYKKCSDEGLDLDGFDGKEYNEDFKVSSSEEKGRLIERIENRIASLIDICDIVPDDIIDKYSREKDLVSIFKK